MKLDSIGKDLVAQLVTMLRDQFYFDRPKKAFFYDHSLLVDAVTYPAGWLFRKGMTREFPADRYREVLLSIVQDIKRHATGEIRHFGRYFLHAVQEHMKHQGDRYYEECKHVRDIVSDVALGAAQPPKKGMPRTDSTLEILAAARTLAAQKRQKRKVAPAECPQLDLFGGSPSAAPLQSARRLRADRP
jgi:hypothetical protein